MYNSGLRDPVCPSKVSSSLLLSGSKVIPCANYSKGGGVERGLFSWIDSRHLNNSEPVYVYVCVCDSLGGPQPHYTGRVGGGGGGGAGVCVFLFWCAEQSPAFFANICRVPNTILRLLSRVTGQLSALWSLPTVKYINMKHV